MNEQAELKSVLLSEIDFGKRARVQYQKIDVLMDDIKSHGLISPIAILDKSKAGDLSKLEEQLDNSKPYLLLAGGRRLTAHVTMGREYIDAKIYTRIMNEEEIKIIELHENIHRENLTWQEEVSLTNEIHSLHIKLYGEKISKAPNAPGHSIRDTASMLERSHSAVSDDIKLAKAMSLIPEVSKAKTKQDALKIIKTAEQNVQLRQHVARIEKRKVDEGTDWTKFKLQASYITGDALERMKNLPDASADMIEIDPPYAVDLHDSKRTNLANTMNYEEWNAEMYTSFLPELLKESYRVLKPTGWLIFWFAPEPWFEPTFQMISTAGFKGNRMSGIWNRSFGQTRNPAVNLANTYEMFFYARKDDAVIKAQGTGNVFNELGMHPTKKWHPTQKPIMLMRRIYRTFLKPDAKIIIPFLGSGVGILAAFEESMEATGTDAVPANRDKFVSFIDAWDKSSDFTKLLSPV
jgi:DNA methylase/ParB-like nuclease domain